MASPLVAGVAALVKSEHPTWTPLMLKAAVMNTATHDVWTGPSHSGHRYGPARVGSGRVDARAAVRTKTIAYTKGANQPVSASFGVVPALVGGGVVTKQKTLVVQNLGGHATTYSLGYDAVNPSPGMSFHMTKSSITVPAHSSKTVTVKLRIVPGHLQHTLDPTMTASQSTGFGDLPRTYVTDSSGHLTVTPQGGKELRVPAYAAAKPLSDFTATSTTPGQIDLAGQPVAQGDSEQDAYLSWTSVMELGATSPQEPECTVSIRSDCWTNQSDRAGDIQYVGAGSGSFEGDPYLWFGISTHRDWSNLNVMTPYVDVDTDGDGFPDIEVYAQNYASAQGRTDVLIAYTVDYKTGTILDIEPVNLAQWTFDTNVNDTNVVMLPMDLAFVADGGPDLTGPDTPIGYWGAMANGYTGNDQDRTSEVAYNVGSPDLRADADPIFPDIEQGPTVPVEGSGDALVFHYRNASGHRAEVVHVDETP